MDVNEIEGLCVDWIRIGWRSTFASVHIVMEFHTQPAILLAEILLASQ
jgi:hypothetical protein